MPEVTGPGTSVKEVAESDKLPTNVTAENGISSTSPQKKSPEKNEGEILLAQGKRHLFIKDFANAVATLGDACAKLSGMFGDLGDECADAYFSYGRALLELAREENNILGTEPEKENSEEEEEEGEGEEEDGEKESNKDGKDETEGEQDKVEENDENEKKEEESTADETKNEEDGEDAGDDEKEEDVDNLQLAWEVFEIAKQIYERQHLDAKLAETYLYLGEVALESENYENAIEDMKKCVEIQKRILAPDHRDIAETYFQLGVACSMYNKFDEAIENFKTSSDILEARIKNLEENGAPEGETEKNPFYSVEKEVNEIKALLPEIKAKISDTEDLKQETINALVGKIGEQQQSGDGAGPSSAPVTNGSTPKPATDISHLVRKKRKPEEESASEPVVKKACTTEVNK